MGVIVTLPNLGPYPLKPFHEPVEWAKKNCPSYITNDTHQDGYTTYDSTKIDFFFGEEKDAMWFKLRWT